MAGEIEYDILDSYLSYFVQHLQDTRTRLGLRVESQANASQATAGDVAEEEGTDATGWTPAEQDAFFRAISVHSRWRPDLIAACVPTKSEWDVWMYLEALEEGAATLAAQHEDEDEDEDEDMDEDEDEGESGEWDGSVDECPEMGMEVDSDPRTASDSDEDEDVELCEPALEVTQAWIDAEERMASWIIDQEHLAMVEDAADVDSGYMEFKPRKRKRGRSRVKRERARGSDAQGEGVSNNTFPTHDSLREGTSTSPSEHFRHLSTLRARKREVLMGRLGLPHLQVLDSILRGGEQAMKEQSQSREGSVTLATPLQHGDDEPSHPGDVKTSSLSDRITEPQGTINIPGSSSVMVIDPVSSGNVDPTGRRSRQVPSGGKKSSGHVPVQGSSLSRNVSPHSVSLGVPNEPAPSNMFTFPQDNAVPTGSNPSANAESDLSLLSPRSRRQIQKRLYMRRKRALLRGDGTALETGIEKLKPGKKAKMEQRETSVVSTSVPGSEAPSDAEGELLENVPKKKNTSGLTLPYRLKAQFAELGVDAAHLVSQGMDLLNLGALGNFMGLWYSLERNEETGKAQTDGAAIIQSIDAQLIRQLQAAVVSFVTDVVHKAIVWRERERRLKQRNQAWRQGDQITIGAVEHAVEIIGARYRSHKAYLAALEARYGLSTEASANAADEPNPRDASVDPDVGAPDLVGEPPRLSVHRDVYTPRIYPPSAWRTSPLSCLTRTYEREASRTRRGTSVEIGEDELMPDETDEEALEAELEDEEEVDERDMMLGKEI